MITARVLLALAAPWVGACSADVGSHAVACAGLYSGDPEPHEELSLKQQTAVGALLDRDDEVVCTGAMITPDIVLTAKHCNAEGLSFATGVGPRPDVAVEIIETFEHATAELMLVQINPTAALLALRVRPLRVHAQPLELGWDSEMAMAVGFGERTDTTRGLREFIHEPVTEVSQQHVTIDGMGESGACGGDSGGPLVITFDGEPVIAGVLDHGSANCLGLDSFSRVDPWIDWIESITGPRAVPCR